MYVCMVMYVKIYYKITKEGKEMKRKVTKFVII